MKNEIIVKGTQNFMGIEIPIVEGGFGENKKCILVNTVAEIHSARIDKINEMISNNIDEFETGVDIIDLMANDNSLNLAKGLGFITNNRQKHCYLLSEQGYMLLVGFMKTEKAKEIRKNLRREYFAMREVINSNEQLKAQLLLEIYNGGQNAVVASKQLTDMEVKEKTALLVHKIEEDKPYTEFAKHVTESSDTVDVGEFAKIVKNENINIGRNRLFEWLRSSGYLMNNNTPYQKYLENEYFKVKEVIKTTAYGIKTFPKTLITGKGQVALVERLRNEFGVED
jgi:phage antirepressor YoqD-like protein